jgi:hypothetical protein
LYRDRDDTYLFRETASLNWIMMMRTSPPTDTPGNGAERTVLWIADLAKEETAPPMAGIEYEV